MVAKKKRTLKKKSIKKATTKLKKQAKPSTKKTRI